MQVSDILRKLADVVDQAENISADVQGETPAEQPEGDVEVNVAHLEPVEVSDEDDTETESMVSPLQQEHELLKKSQGVDNHVDEFAGDGDDELDLSMSIDEEDDDEHPEGKNRFNWGEPEREPYFDMHGAPDEDEDDEVDEGAAEQSDDDLDEMKRLAGVGEKQGPYNYAEDLKPASVNPKAEAARQYHKSRTADSE
jgi:hypothetical protein